MHKHTPTWCGSWSNLIVFLFQVGPEGFMHPTGHCGHQLVVTRKIPPASATFSPAIIASCCYPISGSKTHPFETANWSFIFDHWQMAFRFAACTKLTQLYLQVRLCIDTGVYVHVCLILYLPITHLYMYVYIYI